MSVFPRRSYETRHPSKMAKFNDKVNLISFTLFQQWDITLYLVFWRFLDQILYFMPNKVIVSIWRLYIVFVFVAFKSIV